MNADSADNWRECPKCKSSNAKAKAFKAADALYGHVPIAEFMAVLERAKGMPEDGEKLTLAENYDIGLHRNGEFIVTYNCFCQECGFSRSFFHTENWGGRND